MVTRPQYIARQIRINRMRHGYGLKEFARLSGVDLATLSRYEEGNLQRCDVKVLVQIAKVLKVSLDDLAGTWIYGIRD